LILDYPPINRAAGAAAFFILFKRQTRQVSASSQAVFPGRLEFLISLRLRFRDKRTDRHATSWPSRPIYLDYLVPTGLVLRANSPSTSKLDKRQSDASHVPIRTDREGLSNGPAAVQRGTAVLTTPKSAARARENFDISALPEEAFNEINRIQTRQRLNTVVQTGVPGFIAQGK
jgi:hypothetical protein